MATSNEKGMLKCSNCGSYEFDEVVEMRVSDISKCGKTIVSENLVSRVCARCGAKVK